MHRTSAACFFGDYTATAELDVIRMSTEYDEATR
jgi:hypothetical protein